MNLQNTIEANVVYRKKENDFINTCFDIIKINFNKIQYFERRTKNNTSGNPRYYMSFFTVYDSKICDITTQIAKLLNLNYDYKEKAVFFKDYILHHEFIEKFSSELLEIF